MQPYLFPYLGYFQLLSAVDRFVLYDDVAFIKNGWVNRNRVLVGGEVQYLTVPVRAAMGVAIRETPVDASNLNVRKLRAKLEHGYRKAPHRDEGLALFDEVMAVAPDATIADLARHSVKAVARLLDIKTRFVDSSTVYGNAALKGADRVLDVCRREGATEYCNAPGGRGLYDPATFAKAGIALRFLQPDLTPYAQPEAAAFVPGLSILDVLANVGAATAGKMAAAGTLAA
jgi:hypothetical protein